MGQMRMLAAAVAVGTAVAGAGVARAELRIGMIGCDTSHALEFTRDINERKTSPLLKDLRVTCAYQWGSRDIFSMTNRYPKYLPQLEKMGVKMVPTIAELLAQVDAVLLETNDGREHAAQAIEVFKAGKPVFIDKPLAPTLADALRIVRAAEKYGVKFFTTSSNRFQPNPQKARRGEYGPIESAVVHAPFQMMEKHGRYSWYGIHGFEVLETVMGTGCARVTVTAGPRDDVVACVWNDGRDQKAAMLRMYECQITEDIVRAKYALAERRGRERTPPVRYAECFTTLDGQPISGGVLEELQS